MLDPTGMLSLPRTYGKELLNNLFTTAAKEAASGEKLPGDSTHLPADLNLDWDTPCQGGTVSKTPLLFSRTQASPGGPFTYFS